MFISQTIICSIFLGWRCRRIAHTDLYRMYQKCESIRSHYVQCNIIPVVNWQWTLFRNSSSNST